jgi:hypothetical protein
VDAWGGSGDHLAAGGAGRQRAAAIMAARAEDPGGKRREKKGASFFGVAVRLECFPICIPLFVSLYLYRLRQVAPKTRHLIRNTSSE